MEFFREHLGEAWKGWSEGRPLAAAFFSKIQGVAVGPRAFEVLTQLAAVSSRRAIHDSVVRLGSADWAHFEGTELELAVSGACQQAGRKAVLRESNAGGADLEVTFESDRVFVECKALQHRDLEREASDQMERLLQAAWALNGRAARIVLDGGPEAFVAAVPAAIDYLALVGAERAHAQRRFGPVLVIPGERAADPSCPIEGPGIAALSRSQQGDLLDLMKVRQKVRSKSKQLLEGKGVFVVEVRNAFHGRVDPIEIVAHLVGTVSPLTLVSALMIVQRDFVAGGPPRLLNAPGSWIYVGANTRGLQTGAVLVENPNAECPLSQLEAERLIRLTSLL